jgi:hypothetical protein
MNSSGQMLNYQKIELPGSKPLITTINLVPKKANNIEEFKQQGKTMRELLADKMKAINQKSNAIL